MIRRIVVDGAKPELESDVVLLRKALSHLATHIDAVAAQFEENERLSMGNTSAAGPGPG